MKKIQFIALCALCAMFRAEAAHINDVAEQQQEEKKLSAEEQKALAHIFEMLPQAKISAVKKDILKQTAVYLQKFPAIINQRSTDGKDATLLIKAAIQGSYDIAKLLVDSGADVTLRDTEGKTALEYASIRNDAKIVKLLAANGAEYDDTGWHALLLQQNKKAFEEGKKERQQYLDAVLKAHTEIEERVISDLAAIIGEYAYGSREDLPKEKCVVQ